MNPTPQYKTIDFTSNEIVGNVTFGEGCVIHPTCSIIAEGGEIKFGNFNIIEEKVIIHNRKVVDSEGRPIRKPMIIGDYNLFEMCTKVENSEVGSCNHFEYRTTVSESKIGKGCIIGSEVVLSKKQVQDYQRVFYPMRQKQNDMFEEDKFKENIMGLYEALSTVVPKPRK